MDQPPANTLPVPVLRPPQTPVRRPVGWGLRVLGVVVVVLLALGWGECMRQQAARTTALAEVRGVAAVAGARLDAIVAVVRAAVLSGGLPAGGERFQATATALLAADATWLGLYRADAYGTVTAAAGQPPPGPAVLRDAIITARPVVRLERGNGKAGEKPRVVVAVPLRTPGRDMVETVAAVAVAAHFWRPLPGDGGEVRILDGACAVVAAAPVSPPDAAPVPAPVPILAVVPDAAACRARLAALPDPAGGMVVDGAGIGDDLGEAALHRVSFGDWVAVVPVAGRFPLMEPSTWGGLGLGVALVLGIWRFPVLQLLLKRQFVRFRRGSSRDGRA